MFEIVQQNTCMVPLEMLCFEIVQHNTCMVPLEMLCEIEHNTCMVPLEMLCLRLFSIIPVWFP